MAYPYDEPNTGGVLLRTSSIENLDNVVADESTIIQFNTDAITILNGEFEGSVASVTGIANANTDSLVSGVNLVDVENNKNQIIALNSDNEGGVVGRVVGQINSTLTTPISNLSSETDVNAVAIAAIDESDLTVAGPTSVYKQISDLRDGVSVIYDTVVEVATGTLENDTDLADIQTQATASVTYNNQILADQVGVRDASLALLDTTTFPAHQTTMRESTDSKLAEYVPVLDARYLKSLSLLSEVGYSAMSYDEKVAICSQLGLAYNVYGSAWERAFSTFDKYYLAPFDVVNGVISLDIPPESIKWIRLHYFNNAYDNLKIIPSENPNEYKIYNMVEGDLDGQTVDIRFVAQRLMTTPDGVALN